MRSQPVVMIVLHDLRGGGVQRVLANLASGLFDLGWTVHVTTLRGLGPVRDGLPAGVRVHDLGTTSIVAAVLRLRRLARRERVTWFISGVTRANLVALVAARTSRPRVRTLVTKHLPVSMLSPSRIRRLVLGGIIGTTYRLADKIVAVSEGTAASLLALGIPTAHVAVIANPVLDQKTATRAAAPVDDPWFSGDGVPVVIGVGRLAPQKDFATLIRAFARLRAVAPARLLILGEGPDRASLQRQVDDAGLQEDVRMPGFVTDPLPYVARAAVFVLSSRWEGLPTALIEALAVGTPVVACDCVTGPREILRDGAYGSLVEVGDDAGVAKAIAAALRERIRVDPAGLEPYGVDHATERYRRLMVG